MAWISDKRLRGNERLLIDILTQIEKKHPSIIIIVEGLRDERVLRNLGILAPIIRTQAGRLRPDLVDDIAEAAGKSGEVLILTDYDQEGIELAKFIESELEPRKVIVLRGLRLRIRNAMGNWRCIEELVALFGRKDSPEPLG